MSEQAVASATRQSAAPELSTKGQLMLQRKCACGQHTTGGGECEECRKKRLRLQRWSLDRPGPETIARAPRAPAAAVRGKESTRFGVDLSRRATPTTRQAVSTKQRALPELDTTERQRTGSEIESGGGATASETEVSLGEGSPATTSAAAGPSVEGADSESPSETLSGQPAEPLLVEDDAGELRSGQLRKTHFLERLETAVCAEAEAALAGTDRSTEGCPYLRFWFDYYRGKDAGYVERALWRYAPETRTARSASDYVPMVAARVRQGVERWVVTGEITGVPEDAPRPAGAPSESEPIATETVQLKGKEAASGRPTDHPQAVRARLGRGHRMESGVRRRMESAFGRSFSKVQLHTDADAGRVATEQNARALTVGEHVAFGAGEYRPGTLAGDALIAHELAHVIQQGSGSPTPESLEVGSASHNELEKDADRSAVGAVTSLWSGARQRLAGAAVDAVPQLRSGLALQRCSRDSSTPTGSSTTGGSPATATTVTFQPIAACSGFDDTINPPTLMVPTGGTRQAKAVINPAADAGQVVFESDRSKVTVSPSPATSSPQTLSLTGVARGDTVVEAKRAGSASVLATLGVSVKDRVDKTVAIHAVTETRNNPDLVPANVPTAASLQTYLNDTIWGKQANVFSTVTRDDKSVGWDLDGNQKLADPVLASATSAEINAISAGAKKNGVDFNIYFINEMEIPHAFTLRSRGETWIQSTHVNSEENVSAHELGHAMGRRGESTDSKDVMYEVGNASNPCEVRKRDWDAVNP